MIERVSLERTKKKGGGEKKKSLLFVCWQFHLAGVSAIVGKLATESIILALDCFAGGGVKKS